MPAQYATRTVLGARRPGHYRVRYMLHPSRAVALAALDQNVADGHFCEVLTARGDAIAAIARGDLDVRQGEPTTGLHDAGSGRAEWTGR